MGIEDPQYKGVRKLDFHQVDAEQVSFKTG
jgi:hypothetical protein